MSSFERSLTALQNTLSRADFYPTRVSASNFTKSYPLSPYLQIISTNEPTSSRRIARTLETSDSTKRLFNARPTSVMISTRTSATLSINETNRTTKSKTNRRNRKVKRNTIYMLY